MLFAAAPQAAVLANFSARGHNYKKTCTLGTASFMSANQSGAIADPDGWRPRVLVLDDEWASLERIKHFLTPDYDITTAGRAKDALEAMDSSRFDVVVCDVRMPDIDGLTLVTRMKDRYPDSQYILMTAFSDIEDTISALRLGVADYLRKPFTEGEMRHALSSCLEHQRLKRELEDLRSGGALSLEDVFTKDPRMLEVCRLAETVSSTDATVLISGETGTGKGLLARAMHNISHRKGRAFVTIDCASIPENLIESELFGHERGAFTGAVAKKPGKVELAAGGTLLLDEIGEMTMDMQVKLLRFLQSFQFERVGGTKQLKADVRVVAATNRDLWQEVQKDNFRQDLFYRLHVIQLRLPPLRKRPGDIPMLADIFLKRFALKYSKAVSGFSQKAERQLVRHSWPGNVRELEHAVERAVILSRSHLIDRLDLNFSVMDDSRPVYEKADSFQSVQLRPDLTPPEGAAEQPLADYIADCERKYLAALLEQYEGRIGDTAKAAGINPKTLYLKMGKHGLSRRDFKAETVAASKSRSRG